MIKLSNGYRFEAEALSLSGYRIESSSIADASSGKFIATKYAHNATGKAYGKFGGDAGTYQVEVGYYDESDGRSQAAVTVAGNTSQFRFDKDLGSSSPAPSTHTTHVTHQSIALQKGDPFSIFGKANGSEYARFDYIDFIRLDAVAPPTPTPTPTDTPTTALPTDTPTPAVTADPSASATVMVGNYATCGPLSEAQTQIATAGLQVGTIYPASAGEPASDWQVENQYPAPGEEVPAGTYVDLLVRSPADPCSPP